MGGVMGGGFMANSGLLDRLLVPPNLLWFEPLSFFKRLSFGKGERSIQVLLLREPHLFHTKRHLGKHRVK